MYNFPPPEEQLEEEEEEIEKKRTRHILERLLLDRPWHVLLTITSVPTLRLDRSQCFEQLDQRDIVLQKKKNQKSKTNREKFRCPFRPSDGLTHSGALSVQQRLTTQLLVNS